VKKKFICFAILIISDLTVIVISFVIAHMLRSEILPLLFERFKTPFFPLSSLLDHFYMSAVWILIFASEKLYTKRYPFFEELKVLSKGSTLSFCLIMISIFITRQQVLFSRTVVVLAWIISLILFPLFRFSTKIILRKLNLWKKKLFILGVQQPSLSILKSIHKNKTMGYEVLGFLDNDPQKIGKTYLGVPVLGPVTDLEDVTQKYKSKDIMIATPHLPRT
jgi:FlaA1/EpsC-like NDP-sugar epimerase